jgi:uncharacterized protein YcaQ
METARPIEISCDDARSFLIGHLGLRTDRTETSVDGVRALLNDLRCIQLDPLDRIGTNADLVALARLREVRIGDVYDCLLPGHAFEHFAKERCLLPASAFPYYRERMAEDYRFRWRGVVDLPEDLADEVLAEVEEVGPVTSAGLTDRGKLEPPKDKWTSATVPANSVALELLWTRCQVVVCGRTPTGKLYDVPRRALPDVWEAEPDLDFDRWSLLERVHSAGLMAMTAGPQWTVIKEARTSDLPSRLVEEGSLQLVVVEGSKRKYLAPAGFLDFELPDDDGRMRIVAPLDPLVWDRKLVQQVFDFDYVWEVYKPASKRIWGYYVCPILHRGRLVGRFEGRTIDGRIEVDNLWIEDGAEFDQSAWQQALSRHEQAL